MGTEVLSVVVVLLSGAVLMLALLMLGIGRQVGILHERIAPMGAMSSDRGPEVGEMSPRLSVVTMSGENITIGEPSAANKSLLLLFVSPTCPICKKLLPIARSFVESERFALILVGDGDVAEQRAMRRKHNIEDIPYINSPQVGMAFQVGKLPYAVLIDEEGVLRAKGLVNSREHLESLAVAKEVGFGTIQAYIGAKQRIGATNGSATELGS